MEHPSHATSEDRRIHQSKKASMPDEDILSIAYDGAPILKLLAQGKTLEELQERLPSIKAHLTLAAATLRFMPRLRPAKGTVDSLILTPWQFNKVAHLKDGSCIGVMHFLKNHQMSVLAWTFKDTDPLTPHLIGDVYQLNMVTTLGQNASFMLDHILFACLYSISCNTHWPPSLLTSQPSHSSP